MPRTSGTGLYIFAACAVLALYCLFPVLPAHAEPPSAVITRDDRDWLAGRESISAYVPYDHPPFLYYDDGRPAGYAWELLSLAAAELGLEVLPISGKGWLAAQEDLSNPDGVDVVMLLPPPEGTSSSLVVDTHESFPVATVTRRDGPSVLALWDDPGAAFGFLSGSGLDRWATENGFRGTARQFDLPASGIEALVQGQTQAYVGIYHSALLAVEQAPGNLLNIYTTIPARRAKLVFAVNLHRPRLHSLLQKALLSVPPERTEALRQMWFSPPPSSVFSRPGMLYALAGAGLAGLLLLALFIHAMRLKRKLAAGSLVWQALSKNEERYRNIFENAQVGIFRTSLKDGQFLEANQRLAEMFDYGDVETFKAEFVAGDHYLDPGARQEMLTHLLQQGEIRNFQCRLSTRTGRSAWFEYSARLDGDGLWGVAQDISERKEIEHALAESELKYRTLFENAGDAIFIHGTDGRILDVNEAACSSMNYCVANLSDDTEAVSDAKAYLHFSPEQLEELQREGTISYETSNRNRHGETVHVEVHSRLIDYMGDRAILSIARDVTERKRLETRLLLQTRTDDLTGAHSRRHFLDLADGELRRARRYDTPITVLMLDLDHFKRINDNCGHHAGDHVLCSLVTACQNTLRDSDIVGRIGGEEFAIVLPQTGGNGGEHVAERIRRLLDEMDIRVDGQRIHATVSIGVTSSHGHHPPLEELLRQADKALYQAKAQGRNRVCSY